MKMRPTKNITIREDILNHVLPVLRKINQGACMFDTQVPVEIKQAKSLKFLKYRCKTVREAVCLKHYIVGVIRGYGQAAGKPLCDSTEINNY